MKKTKHYFLIFTQKALHIWLKHKTKLEAKNSVKRVKGAIDLATMLGCRNTKWFKDFIDEVNSLPSYKSVFIDKEINININYIPMEDKL